MLEHDLHVVAIQEKNYDRKDQTDHIVSLFKMRCNVCMSCAVGMSVGCALLFRNYIGIEVEEALGVSSSNDRLTVCYFAYFIKKLVCCLSALTRQRGCK